MWEKIKTAWENAYDMAKKTVETVLGIVQRNPVELYSRIGNVCMGHYTISFPDTGRFYKIGRYNPVRLVD